MSGLDGYFVGGDAHGDLCMKLTEDTGPDSLMETIRATLATEAGIETSRVNLATSLVMRDIRAALSRCDHEVRGEGGMSAHRESLIKALWSRGVRVKYAEDLADVILEVWLPVVVAEERQYAVGKALRWLPTRGDAS